MINVAVLDEIGEKIKAGMSTQEIDDIVPLPLILRADDTDGLVDGEHDPFTAGRDRFLVHADIRLAGRYLLPPLRRVPVYRLGCLPDEGAARLAFNTLMA